MNDDHDHDHDERVGRMVFAVACWFGLFAAATAAVWAVWLYRQMQ